MFSAGQLAHSEIYLLVLFCEPHPKMLGARTGPPAPSACAPAQPSAPCPQLQGLEHLQRTEWRGKGTLVRVHNSLKQLRGLRPQRARVRVQVRQCRRGGGRGREPWAGESCLETGSSQEGWRWQVPIALVQGGAKPTAGARQADGHPLTHVLPAASSLSMEGRGPGFRAAPA